MALAAGARLGSYEIVSALGAGGMGEVYRARDSKLNREVALKVLPEAFTADPERLARFKREAQLLASLNHPNIAQIHGFEDASDVHALIMELVDGPTLADRIANGPIAIDEAIPIAKQIADALEAAHEQGIIHRDLKPANIKLRPDGTVKILDFGLAKAVGPASGISGSATMSPTLTSPAMTQMGMILGTAAYMSPEQAKGRAADKRSDVWAFGCVFYEMLTAKRAFEGEDVSDTLAAVLRGEPDWNALPPDVPDHIRLLLKRCLERDRGRRVADIAVAQFMLTESFALTGEKPAVETTRAKPLWRQALPGVMAVIATAAIVLGTTRYFQPPSPVPTITRFTYDLPSGQRFTNAGRHLLAIAPDGTKIVYVANQRLFLKSISDLESVPIRGSEGPSGSGLTSPVFSPDGKSVAFWRGGALQRIPVTGGTPVTLAEGLANPFGMSWYEGGLLVAGADRIIRVSPGRGSPETLLTLKGGEAAGDPQMLPDGHSLLLTVGAADSPWDAAAIVVYDLQSKSRQTLLENGTAGQYVATGHVVYASTGVLFAVPFDAATRRTIGEARSILEGVARAAGAVTGASQFAVSGNGSLVYIPGPSSGASAAWDLATFDRKGHVEPLKLPLRNYETPRYSPDGKRIAVGITSDKESNIWIYDLSGSTKIRQLTFGGHNRFPVWTPDGNHVTFQSDRDGDSGIFWQAPDGAHPAERLTTAEKDVMHVPQGWFPKGDRLLITARAPGNSYTLATVDVSSRKIEPFGTDTFIAFPHTSISPDGKWVAYNEASSRTASTIFVRPFPPTAKYRVETGVTPFWSPDGRTLYYVATPGDAFVSAVTITTTPSLEISKLSETVPRPLGVGGGPNLPRQYDASPDGEHFIISTADDATNRGPVQGQIRIVLNWTEELKQRVPTR